MSQKIPDTPKIFYNGRRPSVDPLACTSFRYNNVLAPKFFT